MNELYIINNLPKIPKKNAIKATLKSKKEKSMLALTHAPHQSSRAQTKCCEELAKPKTFALITTCLAWPFSSPAEYAMYLDTR